jgi:oligosaccharyltransferase complex subunit epsilon
MEGLQAATKKFITAYHKDTPNSLKLIDVYLVYIMLTGIFQFIYMLVVGTFPYNAFLGGFISTVGSFVLAGNYIKKRTYSNTYIYDYRNSQLAHSN